MYTYQSLTEIEFPQVEEAPEPKRNIVAEFAYRAGVVLRECNKPYASGSVSVPLWGGKPSITPPQTLQDVSDTPTQPERLTGGEDWFEAMLYLRWDEAKLDVLAAALDAIKDGVRDGTDVDDGWTHSLPGSMGLWKVEPNGCRLGEGGKGPIMRWVLERDGVKFGLTKRYEPHETYPSGFFRATGDLMVAHGDARAVWDKVKEWLAELGAVVVSTKLSRVDMCADLVKVHVSKFVEPWLAGQFATRMKKTAEHSENDDDGDEGRIPETAYRTGRTYTGIQLGRGSLIRIYDKIRECRDLSVLAWLTNKRWGGVIPESATRVEFQLRRKFLTAEKCKPGEDGRIARPVIDSIEDYFKHRAELAEYLVTSWVRMNEVGYDCRHPERYAVDPLWLKVQEHFREWAGARSLRRYCPIQRKEISVDDLTAQMRGCLESAAARCGLYIEKPDDLYYFMLQTLGSAIDSTEDIGMNVLRKMKPALVVAPDAADLIPV